MTTLLDLTHQLAQARTRARGLLDTAHTQSRALSMAEQIEFDSLITNCHALEAQIEARCALRKA
jgi:hypothetical protein